LASDFRQKAIEFGITTAFGLLLLLILSFIVPGFFLAVTAIGLILFGSKIPGTINLAKNRVPYSAIAIFTGITVLFLNFGLNAVSNWFSSMPFILGSVSSVSSLDSSNSIGAVLEGAFPGIQSTSLIAFGIILLAAFIVSGYWIAFKRNKL